MKLPSALLLAVGLSTTIASAQTTPPATSTTPESKSPPAKVQIVIPSKDATPAKDAIPAKDAKAAPAKDAKKDPKKDAKKKEDEMGKIEGMEIPRPNGGYLGIRIVDGVWRLTFYNAKRKPIPPDVARVTLRWPAVYKAGDERTVLSPGGDANSMTAPKVVRPPLTFKLFITLLNPGGDGTDVAVENYTIDFRQ
jgi:hypothetical protein